MHRTSKDTKKQAQGGLLVAILLGFLALVIFMGLPHKAILEAKYVQALEDCQFADEHIRFACYKDIVESFLSEHPQAGRDFYKAFLPHIIKASDLKKDAHRYMTPLSSNCHVFMHAVGEISAQAYFQENPDAPPDKLLEILSTECRLGDRVGAITKLAALKDFDDAYIAQLRQSCLKGIRNAGEADLQQCAHALGHVYFDKYVFDTAPLHDGDFDVEFGEVRSEDIEKAFAACQTLSPLEQSGCFNAVAHSFYHLGHFFYHTEMETNHDFSFLFEGCEGLKEFREVCSEAVVYRIGLNEVAPYFLTQNYQQGNLICQGIAERLGRKFADLCFMGVGTFLGQIIHEYEKEELKSACELVEENSRAACLQALEGWRQYLQTRKIAYSPLESPLDGKTIEGSGLWAAGGGFTSDSSPALIYLDPSENFAFQEIALGQLGPDVLGIHEARPMSIRGEYKLALGTYPDLSDDAKESAFVVLTSGKGGLDNLEVEFEERVSDARVRAVFAEDVDNDGEKEIVVGTRPHGILRYYKFTDLGWAGFDIDVLNETIHDILVADTNGNGRNEILATVSPLANENEPPDGEWTGRILSYEFDADKDAWDKNTVWAYNNTFSDSLIGEAGLFEHPRYLFAADINGDGSKEIVANVLGTQTIEVFWWNGSHYSREILESNLAIHDSAVHVGDIDVDGKDEVIALTLPDSALLLYDYAKGIWEREVLAEKLVATTPGAVKYLYVTKAPGNGYGKIFYAVQEGPDEGFYYLERDRDAWRKNSIGAPGRPVSLWGIFPAAPP